MIKNLKKLFLIMDSAVLHHNSAQAHRAAATVQWLENFG